MKVGSKVVCINPIKAFGVYNPPLVKGKIYTVHFLKDCRCGKVFVSVGCSGEGRDTICVNCHHSHKSKDWLFHIERFREIDETFATELLEQIKEEINQEQLVKA